MQHITSVDSKYQNNMIQNQLNDYTESNNLQIARKDDNNMSFVGIGICENGLIAFGDSKSTTYDGLGNCIEDISRGHVQKVFKTKSFILTTCNDNVFISKENVAIRIEDYINKTINHYNNYYDFLENLVNEISSNNQNLNNLYKFMIGGKDKYGYFIRYVDLQNNILSFKKKERKKDMYTMGHSYFVSATSSLLCFPLTIENCKIRIPESIKQIVEKANEISIYNPVGLPINIEIFQ